MIVGIRNQLLEVVERGDPLVYASEGLAEEVRQLRVAAVDPSSWGYSIGLVLDFAWVKFIELLEKSSFQQVRVEGSNTIDCMGADNGEVSHPYLLGPSFFDDTHSSDFAWVSWVFLLQFSDVNMVDQIDKIHMSWQQVLNKVT